MSKIPATDSAPLIRADFSNASNWERLKVDASRLYGGFKANLSFIDDPSFNGLDVAGASDMGIDRSEHCIAFVADQRTMTTVDQQVLCLDLASNALQSFRVVPDQLWAVENNLSIGNMEFEDFLHAVDAEGVFRGFPENAG